ncbi:preprotein translocase subunit SecE [Patescibacteria group bacterium]|nr:preprotein translocase subunit SecE [Patescibacteria group bacterium]MBU4142326.1 preprotein translocase subunit SecE [Patescibacteria group bacterium]MBU4338940.1 preprotein translocase subunit SecE [Patescibacteria group bacterium]MBU4580156.1 preprotein translocase subunit SecE [Patescibacteria group bacterium]
MNIIEKQINFLKEVKTELAKVTFLSKEDLVKNTVSVILVSLAFSVFLGGVDYVFMYLIKTFLLKI